MPTEYFFISDMHIGGDGELQNCDFEVELIDFLKQLERKHGAELIINGDAFGLWEFTTLEGTEKLEALIKQQARLFEQFRKTGEKVPITLMPGNHDYELACYPEYVDRLKEYNLNLVQEVSISREVAARRSGSSTASTTSATVCPISATLTPSRWATSLRLASLERQVGTRSLGGEIGSRIYRLSCP